MRTFLLSTLFLICHFLDAQVFQRKFEDAGALGLGGAILAYPGQDYGIQNEAQLGYGNKLGLLAGSVLPYTLGGWQVGHVQGYMGGKLSGVALDLFSSSSEAYSEQNVRLSYGRKIGQMLYIGGGFDLLRVNAGEYGSKGTITFGLSMLATPVKNLNIAFKLYNPLEAKINETKVPTVLRLGASVKMSPLFLLIAETEKDLDRKPLIKCGIEYKPSQRFTIRTGVRNAPARLGIGVGMKLKNGLGIDFGSEWHPVLGITPALTIIWNKPEKIKKKK